MRWRDVRGVLSAVALALSAASTLEAQASAGMTAAVGRARGFLDAGDGAAARTLLDSLVVRAEPFSDDLAEALFWRAVLSERVSDGERDWKRLVIDAPFSPRVPESLLRLGELEVLRGRPAAARVHFGRILRDFSESPDRAKATIWVARSYFEERDIARACTSINALEAVPDGELRLQVADMKLRCPVGAGLGTATAGVGNATAGVGNATAGVGNATAGGIAPPAVAVPQPAVAVPPPAVAVPTPAVAVPAVWTVQLAAYDTRAQATAVVTRLSKRGIKARVDGERKPFRVRVGRYETHAEAAAMLARLKKQGQRGFVAELGR